MESINFAQVVISILLFMVLFFGIGFIANMLLRSTWILVIVYPIIVVLIIDKINLIQYFTHFQGTMIHLGHQFASLHIVDIIVLSSGLAGALVAGIVIRVLRSRGYQMF